MSRIAFLGLGKLGLPVATAMAAKGVQVFGHDPVVSRYPDDLSHEEGLEDTAKAAAGFMHFVGLADAVNNTDVLVFVAVATPHAPEFEGVTPLPEGRADFDYAHLRMAVQQVVSMGAALNKDLTLVVMSTVLPGTMEREVRPLLNDRTKLVYSPSFIAMGTTIRDFLDPEFVLLGGDDAGVVRRFYDRLEFRSEPRSYPCSHQRTQGCPVCDRRESSPTFYETSVENAELIKVAYNTFIGLKIAFANTLMEVCHKTGCDVDEVTGALKLADRRLVSPAYMDGGMGDGGACHPRDNIALSWLAGELDLSWDLFENVMMQRERQARWLVDLMCEYDLPKGILGVAYKPESGITTGSHAMLVRNMLEEAGHEVDVYDPHIPGLHFKGSRLHQTVPRGVWLVGCKHPEFADLKFPPGSKVIDPFRYIPDQEGVEVVRLGEASGGRHRLPAPQRDPEAVGQRAA